MALAYRDATEADLKALIELLADDPLGATREDPRWPPNPRYVEALAAISVDPGNRLITVWREGTLVGTLQLTFIPYLNRLGSRRCLIEAVRVAPAFRGQGLGAEMFRWAIDQARQAGCAMVQLTSDKTRVGAQRFYERLGFVPSHVGYKLQL